MIQLFPAILLFVLCIFLFYREAVLDRKRYSEEKRRANAHVLKETRRFLADKGIKDKLWF